MSHLTEGSQANQKGSMLPVQSVEFCTTLLLVCLHGQLKVPFTPLAYCHPLNFAVLLGKGHCPATLLTTFGQVRKRQAAPACQLTWHKTLSPSIHPGEQVAPNYV